MRHSDILPCWIIWVRRNPVVLIFLLVFTVIKLSAIAAISKLMKPSEKQIEEARQKRLQAEKEGKDPFEDWDERDDDGLV